MRLATNKVVYSGDGLNHSTPSHLALLAALVKPIPLFICLMILTGKDVFGIWTAGTGVAWRLGGLFQSYGLAISYSFVGEEVDGHVLP